MRIGAAALVLDAWGLTALLRKRRAHVDGYRLVDTIRTCLERQEHMFEFQEPELHLLFAFAQRQTQFPLVTDRLDLVIFHVKVEFVKHVILGHMPVQPEIIVPQSPQPVTSDEAARHRPANAHTKGL